MSDINVGIQWSLPAFLRSSPVITASTPGVASAALASIFKIFACAYGLRTMSMYTIWGSFTSSM